jgi:histidyl-tRNA synthetase
MGLERLVLMLETLEVDDVRRPVDVYMITAGDNTLSASIQLAEKLRQAIDDVRIMSHFGGGNFKKQFKRADKVGAVIALVLGESEIADNNVVLKDLKNGEQTIVSQNEIADKLKEYL